MDDVLSGREVCKIGQHVEVSGRNNVDCILALLPELESKIGYVFGKEEKISRGDVVSWEIRSVCKLMNAEGQAALYIGDVRNILQEVL